MACMHLDCQFSPLFFLWFSADLHPTHADIYKYIDDKGHIFLSDKPLYKGYWLIFKSPKKSRESRVDYRNMESNKQRFALTIAATARSHDLPVGLIHAVIATESTYDPDAVSRAGAVGLMQLMPETALRYGATKRNDPTANLSGGTRYLKDLLAHFGNDLELALAWYNAGESAVKNMAIKFRPLLKRRLTYARSSNFTSSTPEKRPH
jgi:soluble lytic murein transglycosylase-like protein